MSNYILYTRNGTGPYVPQMTYDDLQDLQDVMREVGFNDAIVVNVDAASQHLWLASGMAVLGADADYKNAHDVARFCQGTLWEAPRLEAGTPYYVVTRGPTIAIPGFYEIANFSPSLGPRP